MNETLSDEELSELAECLEDACQEIISCGESVSSARGRWDCYCPLGALFKPLWGERVVRRPSEFVVSLPKGIAAGFGYGFDGCEMEMGWDPRAYELGKLFREKYS